MAPLGVRFYCTVSSNVPQMVLIDPLRIRQIIANGVTNALKHTLCGEVRLHVRAKRGVRGRLNGLWLLAIAGTGRSLWSRLTRSVRLSWSIDSDGKP